MIILGLHLGHDGSACVVRDGRLIAALSSERLSRQRKSHGVTVELIEYVLRVAGVALEEVNTVALSDYHSAYTHGAIEVRDSTQVVPDTWNRVWDNNILEFSVKVLDRHTVTGYNVGHHLSHCAAAYYTSPYPEAFCVSMDSSGGELKSNFVIAHGQGSQLTALETPACMVGLAYGNFTEWLGIGHQMFKAGSTMALAGYGSVLPHVAAEMDRHIEQCFFTEGPRHYRAWVDDLWAQFAQGPHFPSEESDKERARDIAASIQELFERAILRCVDGIDAGGCENICLGGGSFLNCNANTAVLTRSQFRNVHLFPAASDDGCAVGAALYCAHHLFGAARQTYTDADLCYTGAPRPRKPIPYKRIAKALAAGKIVAWSMGRSEYGPRALGHRSLLADPRNYHNRERINFEIKNREWFRPLSPSVLAEHSADWFDHPAPSPFMLFTAPALNPGAIPAAVHIDGTARMQTVTRGQNPEFHRLISEFHQLTGVPMVLNTSLNGQGEPILETDAEARAFFADKPIDMLVTDGEVLER